MVRFSKKLALSSVAAMLLAGGGWMWLQEASAAAIPPNVNAACAGFKQHKIVRNGLVFNAQTTGGIDVTTGGTTTDPAGHQVTSLKVDRVYSMGNVEGIGTLAISMDSSRTAPASTLRANQKGATFPATQTMRFFPVLVLNDEIFKSEGPVEVVSSSVSSFPPKPGTTYVLTNALTLKSAGGGTLDLKPGEAFTVTQK